MKESSNLKILIALEGFIVLCLQVLVSVLLVPFWGQTYTFWVYSLFFSMFGLALGYRLVASFLRWSDGDVRRVLRMLAKALLVYVIVVFCFSKGILEMLFEYVENPIVGVVSSLFIYLFIPTVILAAIPVLAIQFMANEHKEKLGVLTGKTFSLSSLGGVLGVLLTAHLILPEVGVNSGIVLVVLSTLFVHFLVSKLTKSKRWFVLGGVTLFGLVIMMSMRKSEVGTIKNDIEVVRVEEGVLGRLSVVKNNRAKRKYLLVNNTIQSMTHFTGRSLNPYIYGISAYASSYSKGSKALIAGLGCGSLAYEFGEMGFDIDVVDIDDRLHNIVQDEFLKSRNKYDFIHSDVRRYLKRTEEKYDIIVFDLSHGENVPSNVYTKEGFMEAANLLNDGGFIFVHFLSAQDDMGVKTMGSLIKTIEASGLQCEIMNFLNREVLFDKKQWKGNPEGFVFAVSKQEINIHNKELRVDPSLLDDLVPNMENLYLSFNQKNTGVILTDDRPLLDVLHSKIANTFRRSSMKEFKRSFGNER
jgi:spermidine synthase